MKNRETGRVWTGEQDARLVSLVNKHGGSNWKAIAAEMSGKTARNCRERFKNVLNVDGVNGWGREQDAMLERLWNIHGCDWTTIAKLLDNKTIEDVRNRCLTVIRRRTEERTGLRRTGRGNVMNWELWESLFESASMGKDEDDPFAPEFR